MRDVPDRARLDQVRGVLDGRREAVTEADRADHARRAARRRATASVSAGPRPTGFSTHTCLPACAAATATSRCSALGTVMLTTSTAGSSSTSRQSATVRSKPTRDRAPRLAHVGGDDQPRRHTEAREVLETRR